MFTENRRTSIIDNDVYPLKIPVKQTADALVRSRKARDEQPEGQRRVIEPFRPQSLYRRRGYRRHCSPRR